jgi:predicted dehydrogenase
MDKVKLGIIGGGNMAQWAHLSCFGVLKKVELAALYDPREKAGGEVCAKWNIPKYTDSLDELLGMDIDAVCVPTPVQCHKNQIIAALEAEKPTGDFGTRCWRTLISPFSRQ